MFSFVRNKQYMGYSEALEKAGCNIIAFKEFGSYQGTWLAFVEYNGEKGIIEGYYGSCSGCDAFEAEFCMIEPTEDDGEFYNGYYEKVSEERYNELKIEYQNKLRDFGLRYLAGGLYDKSHYEAQLASLKEDDWFDTETKEYCEWAISQNW